MVLGPRKRYRPRKSRSPVKGPVFGSEYAALVHARIHNPRLALQGKRVFDRVTVVSVTGTTDIDLFRDYKPSRERRRMPGPYHVISQRSYPETVLEYSFDTLEEAEAVTDGDERLKKGRVKDFFIVGADDKKLLSKLQEPELRCLYGKINSKAVLPEEIAYNELLNKVAMVLKELETSSPAPANLLEEYRRKQRTTAQSHQSAAAELTKKPVKSTAKESKTMTTATESTEKATKKTPKKAAAKAPTKAVAKSTKGASQKGKAKGKSAKGATNKEASRKASGDGLGREGTLSRFINEQLMAGKTNAAIATAAAKKFPESSSTEAKHVAWSRWKLGQNGVKVPTPKE